MAQAALSTPDRTEFTPDLFELILRNMLSEEKDHTAAINATIKDTHKLYGRIVYATKPEHAEARTEAIKKLKEGSQNILAHIAICYRALIGILLVKKHLTDQEKIILLKELGPINRRYPALTWEDALKEPDERSELLQLTLFRDHIFTDIQSECGRYWCDADGDDGYNLPSYATYLEACLNHAIHIKLSAGIRTNLTNTDEGIKSSIYYSYRKALLNYMIVYREIQYWSSATAEKPQAQIAIAENLVGFLKIDLAKLPADAKEKGKAEKKRQDAMAEIQGELDKIAHEHTSYEDILREVIPRMRIPQYHYSGSGKEKIIIDKPGTETPLLPNDYTPPMPSISFATIINAAIGTASSELAP